MKRTLPKDKRTFRASDPSTPKTTRYLGPPKLQDGYLAWRFSKADLNGLYSCEAFEHEEFRQLWDRLRAFESMNLADFARADSYHRTPISNISREAKERLKEIRLDDVDVLYSFHIAGACRLWCMKLENIMLVLWWDKNHEVYPTPKKYT